MTGKLPAFGRINIGLDIGGTKSHSAWVVTGITPDWGEIVTFAERHVKHSKGTIDADRLCTETVSLLSALYEMGYIVSYVFVDNAVRSAGFTTQVADCKKIEGSTRILIYNMMLNRHKMKFQAVPKTVEALSTALYDSKAKEDKILDDFTTDIDTFDAHFYSWSTFSTIITGRG